jgi:NAD(P)H dehydrogenase (quinone)
MAKVLIIYYSRTGNTAKMANFIEQGLKEEGGVEIEKKEVKNTSVEELPSADGIIIGSPVYYGSMAADIKKFIDESVKFHGKLEGKVGGAFASSAGVGGGNETTIMSIIKALLIHGMVVQGSHHEDHYGPVAIGAPDERSKKNCLHFGKNFAKLVKRLTPNT